MEEWKEKLTQAARAEGAGKRGKRVRLVCGTTSMYTGLDGLMAIVRYHLKLDPCDGSVYVFRDGTSSMLKYIEWDGQSFRQGKRRAQSGSYPWPAGQTGKRWRSARRNLNICWGNQSFHLRQKRAVMVEITALLMYNNDIEKTYESAAEWRALLAKKEDEIASLNRQVEWLTQQLRLMQGSALACPANGRR